MAAMKTQLNVTAREFLLDFGLACLAALGIGAGVGLAAAALVTLLAAAGA